MHCIDPSSSVFDVNVSHHRHMLSENRTIFPNLSNHFCGWVKFCLFPSCRFVINPFAASLRNHKDSTIQAFTVGECGCSLNPLPFFHSSVRYMPYRSFSFSAVAVCTHKSARQSKGFSNVIRTVNMHNSNLYLQSNRVYAEGWLPKQCHGIRMWLIWSGWRLW